ncbi:tellurite resistance TerB family protein [Streptomyces cavernicola]|uniref:TerB family tellurite resistance protein n=1 Tax=Streptomyces cavernicola TaxID=3043613 RepID=A0ABT6SES2_9ACTN|nr:TerB family tellurite resistance protein [Streptomyces sp. B-S-A6]MDI3406354.1 TerB family tellurite resistance protein [Streptomyces sp. B-S-A6]
MLPGPGRRVGEPRIWGIRTAWTTVGDGEFFCPGCGGDRNYRRRTGRRRFIVLGLPLLARGAAGPVVECMSCARHFGTDCLDHPTTVRFSAMLRDAVHTVALAVLTAGGTASRTALDIAVGAVRSAGYVDCTGDQLSTLVAALAADTGRVTTGDSPVDDAGVTLAIELHEALDPLAPHLALAGRESILLQAAHIALADGPYTPAEREVLVAVGGALTICPDGVAQVLESARTAS